MKMIYFVRHGVAVDVGTEHVQSDAERYLSDVGIDRTVRAAKGMNRILGTYPDVILTSPLIRAKQTADIFAEKLKGRIPVQVIRELEPGVAPEGLLEWLAQTEWSCMMLVGHMPDLAMAASLSISSSDMIDIEMKKASACAIRFYREIKVGTGQLEFLIQPRTLRNLAK